MNIEESVDFAAADRFLLVRCLFIYFFLTAYLEASSHQARPHVNFLDDERFVKGRFIFRSTQKDVNLALNRVSIVADCWLLHVMVKWGNTLSPSSGRFWIATGEVLAIHGMSFFRACGLKIKLGGGWGGWSGCCGWGGPSIPRQPRGLNLCRLRSSTVSGATLGLMGSALLHPQ